MAPFKNYEFGQGGVDVDTDPVHLTKDKLLKAQNAIRDPLGVKGGLRNRPGFAKFNASALAGSALGGIGGSGVIPVDARTIFVAQQDGSANEKWYSSSDLFANSAEDTAIAAWQDPTVYFSTAAGVARMGVFFNGQLYYAAAGYTVGTTSPTIRVYNGSDDRELTKLLPATTKGVMAMIAQKGYMYVLTLDSGTSDSDFVGRVFRMSETGEFLQIGTALATGYVPTALAVQNGIIYVGASRLTTTNEARIYRINPLDETSWTADVTLDADDYMVTDLVSFQGLLYATTKNGGAATKGKVKQRSTAGSWSTVDSTTANTGSYDGLAVFGGALYASSRVYNTGGTTAVIRKTSDGSSWSTAYSGSDADGVGRLTPLGLRLFSMGGPDILHTTDGSSWTSAAPAGTGTIDGVLGVLIRTGAAQWFVPQTDTTEPTSELNSVNITASNVGSDVIALATVTITDGQMRSLNTAPVQILAAPGAGAAYVVERMACVYEVTSGMSSSSNLNVRPTGGSTSLFSSVITMNQNVVSKRLGVTVNPTALNANMESFGGVDLVNNSLEVFGSAALTGGATAGGFKVYLWYRRVELP